MPVPKTESRLPAGLQASDLGQSVAAGDGSCCMISYVTSPLVLNRTNQYVVLITDAGLGSNTASYSWSVTDTTGPAVVTNTNTGELSYLARTVGPLQVTVNLLGGGGNTLKTLTLQQDITDTSEELEDLITEAADNPGPGMGDPDALRELINEHCIYYNSVTPQSTESGLGFKRIVFNTVFEGILRRTRDDRIAHLQKLADAINTGLSDLGTLVTQGAGVSSVRLPLLAMSLPGILPFTKMPADTAQRALKNDEIIHSFVQLPDSNKIDLFNIVRFPKTNIIYAGKILETLRDQYFPGTSFDDAITGMQGTRAQWITAQYRSGPVER